MENLEKKSWNPPSVLLFMLNGNNAPYYSVCQILKTGFNFREKDPSAFCSTKECPYYTELGF